MKLIIALGNPDPEYAQTRHNVGWLFLDWLHRKLKTQSAKFKVEPKLNAEVAKTEIQGIKAILAKPTTYVNKSGDAAKRLKPWAKASPADIVLVHDDLDIPFGNCKLSFEKDAAGHHGVESVMAGLKTKKFWRVRIGTGTRAVDRARDRSDKKRDEFVKDFVLKGFSPSERDELRNIFMACEVRLVQALKS